jgi:hypothetical protein
MQNSLSSHADRIAVLAILTVMLVVAVSASAADAGEETNKRSVGDPASAAREQGERLENGIALPAVWPPDDRDPQSRALMPVPYLDDPPEVISIDRGRQLFVDDFLIEQTDLQRTYHRAEKFSGNPVLKPETAWELAAPNVTEDRVTLGEEGQQAFLFLGQGGVFFDPAESVFRMFYVAGWRGGLALATSRDLVHWERPDLQLAGDNLLLPPGVRWTGPELTTAGSDNCVWLDLHADDPAQRIKFMTCWMHVPRDQRPPGSNHSLHTGDGRTWSEGVLTGMANDYCSFFYNPFRDVWVFSIKQNGPHGRCRYYSENQDFLAGADWSNAVYWTGADELDAPEPEGRYPGAGDAPQLYSLNAVAYESLLVGMHYIHRGPNNRVCHEGKFPKLIDLELGFSRDGFHWHRPDRSGFITAERTEGAWDRAYLHSTAGVFAVLGERLVFPYVGTSGISPTGSRGMYTGGSIGIATLRRDGFASMDADQEVGTLTTRPVSFEGSQLFVNLDAPRGALRVAVLDEMGNEIAPFTMQNCRPLAVDSTLQNVEWIGAGDLSALKNRPVRFRFALKAGSLYSFWVSPDESGRSGGYLAAGGPGYPGTIDTVGRAALEPPTTPSRDE